MRIQHAVLETVDELVGQVVKGERAVAAAAAAEAGGAAGGRSGGGAAGHVAHNRRLVWDYLR